MLPHTHSFTRQGRDGSLLEPVNQSRGGQHGGSLEGSRECSGGRKGSAADFADAC
jgi:hypothetical protein